MSSAKARQTRTRLPKQSRAQSTVSAILEGAARVLAERGWAGFNTNVVAERAGVSIGSLYEYFPNKQAIADAIVSEHLAKGEAMLAAAATNASSKSSLESLVASLVDGFVNLHKDDPRLHRVLSSEVPLSSEARVRVGALKQRVIASGNRARWLFQQSETDCAIACRNGRYSHASMVCGGRRQLNLTGDNDM